MLFWILIFLRLSFGENILCSEENCRQQNVTCTRADDHCTVACVDELSCFNANIQCNAHTPCYIICNSVHSCSFATILCPNDADCVINGVNANSLSETLINCPTSNMNKCDITCADSLSCSNAIIYGENSSKLTVECNHYHSCFNFVVFCPPYNESNGAKNCIIQGNDNSIHTDLQFYATNGFIDIDVSNYTAQVVESNSSLFCGYNYSQSCIIDNTFNCVNSSSPCYLQTTILEPTFSTSVAPTLEPTIEPTFSVSSIIANNRENHVSITDYAQTDSYMYFYIGSIMGLTCFCVISVVCLKQRKTSITEPHYGGVYAEPQYGVDAQSDTNEDYTDDTCNATI